MKNNLEEIAKILFKGKSIKLCSRDVLNSDFIDNLGKILKKLGAKDPDFFISGSLNKKEEKCTFSIHLNEE